MKKILFCFCAAIVIIACGKVDDKYYGPVVDPNDNGALALPTWLDDTAEWAAAADSTAQILIDKYWWSDRGFFNYDANTTSENWQYWPQAHAMDVLIDAYMRDKTKYATFPDTYFTPWYEGIEVRNGNSYYNSFTDDMEWIGITMVRLYEATGESKYLDTAKELWGYIIATWTDVMGGGLFWETGSANRISKNACSNGPAVVMACLLYNATESADEKDAYLNDAKRIYDWERSVLFNQATGAVYDNIKNNNIGMTTLTYNEGTFVGAAHLLYGITEDGAYLADAVKAADFTISSGACLNGAGTLLRDEGTGDGGLFKGIFIRYFTELAAEPDLDDATAERFGIFISNQAVTAWTKGITKPASPGDDTSDMLFFSTIWDTPSMRSQLSAQTSGSTLMEAMAKLQSERQ